MKQGMWDTLCDVIFILYIFWNIVNFHLFIWLDLIQCKTVGNGWIFQLETIKKTLLFTTSGFQNLFLIHLRQWLNSLFSLWFSLGFSQWFMGNNLTLRDPRWSKECGTQDITKSTWPVRPGMTSRETSVSMSRDRPLFEWEDQIGVDPNRSGVTCSIYSGPGSARWGGLSNEWNVQILPC